jgi:hypothetical protein
MKYLCLGYHDEQTWNAMSPQERQALLDETLAYQDDLRRNGHYIDGKALQGVRSAATLRFEKGHLSVTDGPFAETKEQLGGYHLIDCKDLDEAISIAQRIPTLRAGGVVEVRPLEFGLEGGTR